MPDKTDLPSILWRLAEAWAGVAERLAAKVADSDAAYIAENWAKLAESAGRRAASFARRANQLTTEDQP